MAIRTDIATHYFWRQVITAVICLVLAVWGAYDLWVKIPAQQAAYEAYLEDMQEIDGLATIVETGGALTPDQQARYEELEKDTAQQQSPPSTLNALVQWMFISCILGVPWCLWSIHGLRTNRYELDEHGNLHLPHGDEWKRDEIAGIDMSRWMAKSVAYVEHISGKREKLDAYLRKNMELIVGGMSHRFEPGKWTREAKPVEEAGGAEEDAPDRDAEPADEESAVA